MNKKELEETQKHPENVRIGFENVEQEFAVAAALSQARRKAGLTQADVASRLGISQPAIARMESGKNLSLKTICRYAKAVNHIVKFDVFSS